MSSNDTNGNGPISQAICITGMHRSGTSLTASWLELCGLAVHEGNFHGPAVGNPKGHFEDKEFVDIHSAAIKSAVPGSNGWKIFTQNEAPLAAGLMARAQELVARRDLKFSLWGWKDPRSVFFLHEWKRMIPTLKTLLIWRSCDEVTQSLLIRSENAKAAVFKISADESVRLWRSYNTKVCAFKKKYPEDSLLLPLEVIANRDRKVLSTINDAFKVSLHYLPIDTVFDKALLTKGSSTSDKRLKSQIDKNRDLADRLMALSDLSI